MEEFRLSDAFEGLQGEPQVELICKAYNINPDKGQALKEKSYVLRGYCLFVEKVRAHLDADIPLYDALDKGIQECIREHILEDFFREHGNEVRKMEVSCQLRAIESEEVLKILLRKAASVQSIEQFTSYMKDIGIWKEAVLTQ